jgi:hypothetical protein
MDLPIYEIDIDELDLASGINLIAIVDAPAIGSNFIKLSEDIKVELKRDSEKRYVTGAVLIADKPIYRRTEEKEFYINFSLEAIEKIRNQMFKSSANLKLANLDHSAENQIDGYLIESWIVTDEKLDKAVALGFQDVKVGTLYCTYHFPTDEAWNEVAKRNGYSLEGNFISTKQKLAKEDTVGAVLEDLIKLLDKDAA